MKLMNEISATCDGVVEEILVENEDLVEYGQVIVKVSK
jgi:acetyl-CoA carboxylase biotin carboxyl carrier protein